MSEMKKGLPPEAYEEIPGDEYPPYIPASEMIPEFTIKSVLLGIILGIVFGAANAYLGLKVGLTVSASIPVAVISMGILRGLLRRGTILENNMVQTVGSAGESLAAGIVFTIPAIWLWNVEGLPGMETSNLMIFTLAIIGGLLGVMFMIPLRRYLIMKEHGKLLYPEGTACAEVLVAGDTGGAKAITVFQGVGIGALYKFLMSGFKMWHESPGRTLPAPRNAYIGIDAIPALLGVGYIIGPRISAIMLSGGALSWLVFIPMIYFFGQHIPEPLFPAESLIRVMPPDEIWHYYIRYIGAGAVAFGGLMSLIKALPTIISSFIAGMQELTKGLEIASRTQRTQRDLPIPVVFFGAILFGLIIAFIPWIKVGFLGALLVVIFSFFFVTVSSRIVGLIGSSSNPASGMTIATLLATTLILSAAGMSGSEGMFAAITVGAIVCIGICIAGDTSQDLKTGFLVGATPYRQQIGEFIGVATSALFIGLTLSLLLNTYGIGPGEEQLKAPQATLMSLVVKGVMTGNLPWHLVFIGMLSAAVVELFGVPSLAFAVGLYLPISLSTPIMVGGAIRWLVEQKARPEEKEENRENGILYSSGLIAGEAIIGILLAIFKWQKWDESLGFADGWMGSFTDIGTMIIFAVLCYSLWRTAMRKKK